MTISQFRSPTRKMPNLTTVINILLPPPYKQYPLCKYACVISTSFQLAQPSPCIHNGGGTDYFRGTGNMITLCLPLSLKWLFQDDCIGSHIGFQTNLKSNNTWSGMGTEHSHQVSLKSLQWHLSLSLK